MELRSLCPWCGKLRYRTKAAAICSARRTPRRYPRAATPALPVPGGVGMAPDIPAAATATPARPRTIAENRPVTVPSPTTCR
jgi:hypothetical protein